MQSVALSVGTRSATRRAAVKKLRESGKIPAVIYGKIAEPQALTLDNREFTDMLKKHASEHLLVELSVEGDERPKRMALLQEIQHHALSRDVLHVDFHEIAETDKVSITIPVESTGEAIGVKVAGGLLEHVLHHVKIRGLVKNIPEVLVVDVSELAAGHTLHIGELSAPEGCEFIGNASNPVFTVTAKRGGDDDKDGETPGAEPAAAAPAAAEAAKK